jgi:hypothetical protein
MNNILTGPALCSFQVTEMSYYAPRSFPLGYSRGNAQEYYNNYDEGNPEVVFKCFLSTKVSNIDCISFHRHTSDW